MKKFDNKKTTIEDDNGGLETYANLVKACSDFIPIALVKAGVRGWDSSLTKESFRVEESVSKAGNKKTIEIEDNDIALIKKFCSDFPWSIRHKDLVEFDDYIKQL